MARKRTGSRLKASAKASPRRSSRSATRPSKAMGTLKRSSQLVIEATVSRIVSPLFDALNAELAQRKATIESVFRVQDQRIAELAEALAKKRAPRAQRAEVAAAVTAAVDAGDEQYVITRFGVNWDRVHPKVNRITVETADGKEARHIRYA